MYHIEPGELEAYLHDSIPLTAAMGVRVVRCDGGGVELSAPLDPNRNPHGGGFGGSIAALALTAAWAVVHHHVSGRTPAPAVVVADQRLEYLAPVTGEMRARSRGPAGAAWARLDRALERRGRGRIALEATVHSGDALAARLAATFVALGG